MTDGPERTEIMSENSFHHQTVLLHETVDALGDIAGGLVVDCTLGGGGHTALLLERVGPSGRVIAFDRDKDALENAKRRFAKELASEQLVLVDAPFSELAGVLKARGAWGKVRGVIADIGVSSHQIDSDLRGFSFMTDGPLDMRMDPRSGQSAAEFLATEEEFEIAKVIYELGEEHKSRQIARRIVESRKSRPIHTTLDLANLVASLHLWKDRSKKHPATKTFQALRIHVNDELGELRRLVDDGFQSLQCDGILAIISFHSLEDRIIKEKFLEYCGKAKSQQIPRDLPLTSAQVDAMINKQGEVVGDFPFMPTADEVSANPRSRSAKLRAIRKTTK